jgi:hypothetical protein
MTKNGMDRACGSYEEKRNAHRILVENPDVSHLDNIDGMLWMVKKYESREWTGFVWRAVVNTVLNFGLL